MKNQLLFYTCLLVVLTANSMSGQIELKSVTLKYNDNKLMFETYEGDSITHINQFRFRYTINDTVYNLQTTCGVTDVTVNNGKPYICSAVITNLQPGNNIIYVTQQAPPIENVEQPESPRSTPLVLFYGAVGTQSEPKCKAGSYSVQRITDATKLQGAVNSVQDPAFVSNILATSNAIYVFSCLLNTAGSN